MPTMSVQQIFDTIDSSMAEVKRQLASGEMDGSGRFYTDEELARGAATGGLARKPDARQEKKTEAPAA